MKWWRLALAVVLGSAPWASCWWVPAAAWALDPGVGHAGAACAAPWRAWAAVYRGSLPASVAYPCAGEVVAGWRGNSLRRGLDEAARPLSLRREWARLLVVAGPAEDLLGSPALPLDLRRGLLDEGTVAHADDDLVALAARHPLGGVLDEALLFEALASGTRTLAEPVLAEPPNTPALRPLLALAAGLPGAGPASLPAANPGSTVLSPYGPVGEALAEHVFAEWAAVRTWVAAGGDGRGRAERAISVLVGEAPGEPWMSIHALVRGERVVPVLVGLAAIDLGLAAGLPVRVRGDADEVVAAVGHLAVYAPRCGPRRPVALPGTRGLAGGWGDTTAAQVRTAAILADDWGEPCAAPVGGDRR